jgi:hypothetical protein
MSELSSVFVELPVVISVSINDSRAQLFAIEDDSLKMEWESDESKREEYFKTRALVVEKSFVNIEYLALVHPSSSDMYCNANIASGDMIIGLSYEATIKRVLDAQKEAVG